MTTDAHSCSNDKSEDADALKVQINQLQVSNLFGNALNKIRITY